MSTVQFVAEILALSCHDYCKTNNDAHDINCCSTFKGGGGGERKKQVILKESGKVRVCDF